MQTFGRRFGHSFGQGFGIGVCALAIVIAGCGNSADAPKSDKPSADQKPTAEGKPTTPEKVTDGKVKIEEIKVGKGDPAGDGDTLVVFYTGMLTNGSKFDSTSDHNNEPFSLVLGSGSVIKGWEEGLRGIKVGGKRKLLIPSALGYGPSGSGEKIPPNSDLIFEVELLDKIAKGEETTVLKEEVAPGTGRAAKTGDTVSILYTGTLSGGKKFDSTADRNNAPLTFTIGKGEVIPGFDLAVTGLKKGGKRKVTIPPALGYGMQPQGPIPPNSILHFDIELLSIK